MNLWRNKFRCEFRARYLLAALSGLLLGLAFPKFSVAGLAWVAPGLLLFSGAGAAPRVAFRAGFVGGMVYYLMTLYWLLHIPVPILPIFGWIALSAYVAIYPGLWVWLCWKFFPGLPPGTKTPWEGTVLSSILSTRWLDRTRWTLQCAAIWVALEMVLARFLSGFPWEFLGVSQYKMLPIIQVASVAGVYGVSFLIIWFAISLMLAAIFMTRAVGLRRTWTMEIALPTVALCLVGVFGFRTVRDRPTPQRTLRAALIQPSIPQTLIWDERENENRFRQLMALSEQALTEMPDLMIWPEASVPNMIRHHRPTSEAIIDLVMKNQVWAIVGSDDADYRPGTNDKVIDYFNSAFAISPQGGLVARYVKRQLVIFGEYMPFVEWLPFLRKIAPAGESGFTPGRSPATFYLSNLEARASVLICFEDTFPHLVPEYVKEDTDFLVNLTNNGWFGESAAQWQHAAAAVFRAVENRIPLVRCANNGLTCWVDETGGMHAIDFPDRRDVYARGYKLVDIPLLAVGEKRALTFYTRHGDLFGWACVAFVALKLILARLASRRGLRT